MQIYRLYIINYLLIKNLFNFSFFLDFYYIILNLVESIAGSEIRHRDDMIPFCHTAIALEGCGWNNADNIPLMIASTIIGAWDRTQGIGSLNASAIARAGAEGKALSYQAFNTCYKDTGLWGIYFICERNTVEVSNRHILILIICSILIYFTCKHF